MTKNYGLPYMGSKNFIAKYICEVLPKAENYYDLFCGGGAILHRCLESKKYKNYFVNDLNPLCIQGLKSALNGEYKGREKEWVSREEFFKKKDKDFFYYSFWSFGNSGRCYIYGKHIEPWKKALHYALALNDFSYLEEFDIKVDKNIFSRDWIRKNKEEIKDKYINWYCEKNNINREEAEKTIKRLKEDKEKIKEEQRQYLLKALKESGLTQAEVGRRLGTQMEGHYFGKSQFSFPTREYYEKMQEFLPLSKTYEEIAGDLNLENLQRLQRLESLEGWENLENLQRLQRLESLQSLQSLGNLEFSSKDYRELEIKPNSVVYCDIPYKGTESYLINDKKQAFNHDDFYNWAEDLAKRKDVKIFISEYEMPSDRFVKIKEFKKISFMCSTGLTRGQKTDNLYIPKKQEENYKKDNQEFRLPCFEI